LLYLVGIIYLLFQRRFGLKNNIFLYYHFISTFIIIIIETYHYLIFVTLYPNIE